MTSITIEAAARELIRAIYDNPTVPEPAVTSAAPETMKERQCYRNGYYSARDLPEFKRLAELLKENDREDPIPPGDYDCTILDAAVEPGRKPGDLKAMLTIGIPSLGTRMRVEAGSAKVSVISEAAAKKLVQHVTQSMEKESALLQPHPQVFMRDPYALLDLIRQEANIIPETVDTWMLEAQNLPPRERHG